MLPNITALTTKHFLLLLLLPSSLLLQLSQTIMSDTCGNCDCSDKTQCVKKGYTADIVETEKSYTVTMAMDGPSASENDGKCKCGSSCTCTSCGCGH